MNYIPNIYAKLYKYKEGLENVSCTFKCCAWYTSNTILQYSLIKKELIKNSPRYLLDGNKLRLKDEINIYLEVELTYSSCLSFHIDSQGQCCVSVFIRPQPRPQLTFVLYEIPTKKIH